MVTEIKLYPTCKNNLFYPVILFVVAFRVSVIGGFGGPEASFSPSKSSELVNKCFKLLFAFFFSFFLFLLQGYGGTS